MKELSIEDKAKCYDEAKLRMSAAYNSNRCTIGFMNEIFPELKESDNERIRKAIGYAIGQSTHSDGTLINGVSSEEALAWLEKQSSNAYKLGYTEGMRVKNKEWLEKQGEKSISFTFDDILALQCCMETVKKVQEDKDLYFKLLLLHNKVYDAYTITKR